MSLLRTNMTYGDRARDAICVFLLAALVILIDLQVFYRYVLNDPLSWPEEIARNAFIWLVALGTVKLFRERSNYVINFFLVSAPAAVQRAAAFVYDIIALLLFIVVLVGSWPVLVANARIKTAIGLPINLLYASFAVASVLVIVAIVVSLLERRNESKTG
ncbi:MAG: hypothetical protein A3G35_18975 [candidate division NC10 bacterium RIFCSPLOWO2_12_FULL_66_18]|nr:MAG: hypothetical protein A3H39_09310 [candidate division NC10 bacterium RIFCSPLOWO2_02_FULL_66_22]OGB96630.1 MAG: hypothetical protein A3G35_18975 [candidate division NC10 bacterium RIFCSPLOWO2_12_FULL_66_18]